MISSLGGHAVRALIEQPVVEVDRSRCTRHRFARSTCRSCTSICPTGAINWTEAGLAIDGKTCSLCLLCTAHCPTEALRSSGQELAPTLNDLSQHDRPVLGCRKHATEAAHARIPCLGQIASPKALLLLDLLFPDGLQINLSLCRDCENVMVPAAIKTTSDSLRAAGWATRLKFIEHPKDLDCSVPMLSRREMFGFFKKRSVRSAGQVIERVLESSAARSYGDKTLPEVHELLNRTIDSLPESPLAMTAQALMQPALTISDQCSGCTGCVGVCPTGALVPAETHRAAPSYQVERCVACGLCASFCRRSAIEITLPAVSANTP
jgi:ferredoxin